MVMDMIQERVKVVLFPVDIVESGALPANISDDNRGCSMHPTVGTRQSAAETTEKTYYGKDGM